jgi:hypothetical protein
MARKTIEKIYSDMSGEEVEGGSATYFALDGTSYEIDLTDAERKSLIEALEPYVAVARKARGGSKAKRSTASGPSSDAKAMRAWAADNNVDVPARGRIPAAVVEAYEAAK